MDDSIGIADLAVLVTTAGVVVYVLGLIGLAIPIRTYFTGNLSSAWYVVSLVPRTVVAGQGVRIWMRWPFVIAALLLLVVLGLELLLPSIPRKSVFTLVWWILVIYILVINYISWKLLQLPPNPGLREEGSILAGFSRSLSGLLTYLALMAISALGMVLVISGMLMIFEHGLDVPLAIKEFFPILPPPYRGIMVLLIGSFVLGLPSATLAYPPFPKVQIIKQPEIPMEEVPDPLEGYLVAHSDGFWHLFLDAEEQAGLLSIPDDNVLVVRMMTPVLF